jgi:predicted permease
MTDPLKRFLARIRNRRFDQDLADELRFHEEMKRQELEARGMASEDARAAARRALGNATLMREESRRVWIAPWIESVVQDVRYAIRTLVRQPLHSATAVTVLILAIGLNAALFAMFKALAMEPWPVDDPGSVVRMWARTDSRAVGPSVDEFRFMREHVKSFSGLAAHTGNYPEALRATGLAEVSVRASWASANFFDVLGIRTQLGGGFVAEDDLPGNRRAPLLLSDAAWRNRFTRDPNVVGRAVFVEGQPFTIVGVLEPRFDGNGAEVEIWMPLSAFAVVRPSNGMTWEPSPGSATCCVATVGRIAQGVSKHEAQQELQLLHQQFSSSRQKPAGRVVLYGTAEISGPSAQRFALLGAFGGAVLLVLVLACANVGNLQLARALSRRREIATRLSIGASRTRIVRQLLTEGLVLACGAGVFAVVVAIAVPRLVFRVVDEDIPPYALARLDVDAALMLFILAICVLSCLVFALAPALHATRVRIPLGIIDRSSTRPMRFHLRSILLATQIAACTVLLTGAGLVTRAVAHAMRFDPGFDIEGVQMVAVAPPRGTSSRDRQLLGRQTLASLHLGGAPAVAFAEISPLSSTNLVISMALPDRDPTDYESVLLRPVSGGYFEVLGVPLVGGRTFGPDATTEVVINEAFVRTFWREQNPLGRTVREVDRKGGVRRTLTIVGIVRDAYLTGLETIDPVVFTPSSMGTLSLGGFLTRGGTPVVERIRATVLEVSPAAAVTTRPLREDLRKVLDNSRAGAAFAWGLGLLGLALAGVGVFGVFAYSVEERRREIGLRLALGAARAQIVRMLVASSGRAMTVGLAVGVLLSFGCGPVLRRYLFGLSAQDPLAYGMVIALLACAGLLATFVPARRACRLDPAVTLREE